jgi:Beta-lactamase enzyme family
LWRPGVDEDTASIVKVDTLATLLHQDQTSGTSLSANEESLATSMIEISDNDAATDLWDDAGQATGIGSFDSLLDLNSTVPGSDGYWGLTQTTASDQIELPQSLVLPNQVLDAGSRAYELGLMEQVTSSEDWGVSSGVPQGVTVALKNGWLPLTATNWRINSVGWIDGQGRDYLLAVLTDGNPTESYGIDTIQGISSLAWAALAP